MHIFFILFIFPPLLIAHLGHVIKLSYTNTIPLWEATTGPCQISNPLILMAIYGVYPL